MCKHDESCDTTSACVQLLDPSQVTTVLATRQLPNGEFEATPAVVRTDVDVQAQLAARQLTQLNVATNAPLFAR